MQPVVECVPNFSEGRRVEVLEAIEAAVVEVPGVTLLNSGMDPDHNRAVLTFVGPAAPVGQAAVRAAAAAKAHIDISKHEGVHPRIGATDVIPFVPLRDTPMDTCVELAHKVARQIAEELQIPAFLYGEAASDPSRRELVELRRHGPAGLQRAMDQHPDFRPDYGPPKLHPTAGAVAVGARQFLIAFNVDLDTADASVAEEIAKRIRSSSGGLPGVKALGLKLAGRGKVQVSMNLTDFRKTSLGMAYRRIEELARRYGVRILGSELIGLVPRAALVRSVEELLGLELERDRIVEDLIRDVVKGPVDLHAFLADVASDKPSPGGGAAAALAGALGAVSAAKVVAVTKRRTKPSPETSDEEAERTRERLKAILRQLHALRWELLEHLERDADAFAGYAQALKLPKKTEAERSARAAALAEAAFLCSETPVAIAESLAETLRALEGALDHVRSYLLADAVVACSLVRGALEASGALLGVNLPLIGDEARAGLLRDRFGELRREIIDIAGRTEARLAAR